MGNVIYRMALKFSPSNIEFFSLSSDLGSWSSADSETDRPSVQAPVVPGADEEVDGTEIFFLISSSLIKTHFISSSAFLVCFSRVLLFKMTFSCRKSSFVSAILKSKTDSFLVTLWYRHADQQHTSPRMSKIYYKSSWEHQFVPYYPPESTNCTPKSRIWLVVHLFMGAKITWGCKSCEFDWMCSFLSMLFTRPRVQSWNVLFKEQHGQYYSVLQIIQSDIQGEATKCAEQTAQGMS